MGDERRRHTTTGLMLLVALVLPAITATACVPRPEPTPAVQRQTPPPWDAPRDAISSIEAAGLEPLPLDATGQQHVLTLAVTVDGTPVTVPGLIGIDRPRALQAPVHTHDGSGQVWLEGKGADQVTLAQFFLVWGVRFDDRCLGAACGAVAVTADGRPVDSGRDLRLMTVDRLTVSVRSA